MTDSTDLIASVFRHLASYEFSANFGKTPDGEDLMLDFRADILRHAEREECYRARLWEIEPYRIQPSFPQEDGEPSGLASDEFILTDRGHFLEADLNEFEAPSAEEAFEVLLESLRSFIRKNCMDDTPGQ